MEDDGRVIIACDSDSEILVMIPALSADVKNVEYCFGNTHNPLLITPIDKSGQEMKGRFSLMLF